MKPEAARFYVKLIAKRRCLVTKMGKGGRMGVKDTSLETWQSGPLCTSAGWTTSTRNVSQFACRTHERAATRWMADA